MITGEVHCCGRCGRKIKSPKAIAAGMGRVCQKKVRKERAAAEMEKNQIKLAF